MKHPLSNIRTSSAFLWIQGLSRRRSIRLTSEGTRFLFFTFGIGLAAINTGNNLFYLLLAMMLSLIIISGWLSEHCLRRLEFHRHVPDLIMANEPTTITVSVANRNRHMPSFSLRLLDVIEGQDVDRGLAIQLLPPQSSVLLSYPLLATTRGWIRFEGIRVHTLFPFGLFLKKGLYSAEIRLLVAPPIKPLTLRFVDELVSEGQGQSLPRRGHGTQLYNLRLYQPGDDSRSIHWMTTARTSHLIVRETEAEDQRRITVLLSIVAPEERDPLFERSVTFVASLLWQLTERAYPVRLIVGTDNSGLGTGSAHLLGMLRLLALCKRQPPRASAMEQQTGYSASTRDDDQGYTVAVVPWSDEMAATDAIQADRVLHATQLEELTHAF
ncbi:MAG: hypothetical protein A2V62_03415 [Nitrospirae bacterium RBG_19FT_COMBO_58_9]|nr:MAG: hypothetical protein A2V62_03415 [Nitrospirae bacterium RBG_19FT_COMBO_58_9]